MRKSALPVHVARVEEGAHHDARQVDRLDEVGQQSPLQPQYVPPGNLIRAGHCA
jgi:hypothetical protein